VASSSSSHAISTDSPILPSDEDKSPGLSSWSLASRLISRSRNHDVAPSAADMDVFALSTENVSDTNSIRSIPTSFVSGEVTESVINHESFWMEETVRRRAYRQTSETSGISANLSLGSPSLRRDCGRGSLDSFGEEIANRREQNSRAPHLAQSMPVSSVKTGNTISDVQGGQIYTSRFARFKMLGEKIKKAIGIQIRAGRSQNEIGAMATTAITAVGYTSVRIFTSLLTVFLIYWIYYQEHAASRPSEHCRKSDWQHERKSPGRGAHNQRYKFIPDHARPEVSHPFPLRSMSFLAMDSGPPLLRPHNGREFSQVNPGSWISRQPLPDPSPSLKLSRDMMVPSQNRPPLESPQSNPKRSHFKSSPGGPGRKAKRFSFSSSLSKSQLDILKHTILPHPPLPPPRNVASAKLDGVHSRVYDSMSYAQTTSDSSKTTDHHQLARNNDQSVNQKGDYYGPQTYPELNGKPSLIEAPFANSSQAHNNLVTRVARRESSVSIFRGSKDPSTSNPEHPNKRRSKGFSFTKRNQNTPGLSLGHPSRSAPAMSSLPNYNPQITGHDSMPFSTLLKDSQLHENGKNVRRVPSYKSLSSIECAGYDPNLTVDTMSFAQTPGVASSAGTSSENLVSPEIPGAPMHAICMDNLGVNATMSSAGLTQDEDADDIERDRQDREEERGFLKALGLEFEDITRRA
jgi:hypothetical protein